MYTQVGDQEATSLETFILRLDTEDTPSGRFPVSLNKSLPHADRVKHVIGYDAAVCLQRWEPWIIEAYNTSIASPSALRIVGKGTRDTSLLPSGNIQGAPIENTRYLNTTGKELAFGVTYDNSLSKMVKEISRNSDYIPSPTVGPVVPPRTASNLNLLRRRFLLPKALDLLDTLNSPRTCSQSPVRGLVRLTLYHTPRGRHPLSHNCTRMRR